MKTLQNRLPVQEAIPETYKAGDLLELRHPYLQDERFRFYTMDDDGCTGFLIDPETEEAWETNYSQPYELSTVYEKVQPC